MMRKLLSALAMIFLSACLSFAAEKVPVEAEGSGATRMEALRAAWMEAVRSAVGMSMAGTTRLSDDTVDEAIATYSRGHVDAYEVLSESMDNGIWTIRIRAEIDKDDMQPLAKGSGSGTIDLARSGEAAAALSAYEAQKDGVEMFISAYESADWASLIDYSLSIRTIDKRLWLVHRCKINFENYFNFANELAKALEKIAVKTRTVPLDGYLAGEIRDLDDFYRSNYFHYDEDVLNRLSAQGGDVSLTEVVSPFHVDDNLSEHFDVYVATSPGEVKAFKLENSDLRRILRCMKCFDIVFTVKTVDADQDPVAVPVKNNIHLLFYVFNDVIHVTPTFGMLLKPNSMYFNTLQELKLTSEQLDNISTLNGTFALEGLEYTNDLD